MLPPITACWDSAPPEVNRISSTRPYFRKMPARWPSSATPVSHRPRCGTETRTFSWPEAGEPRAPTRAANARKERKLRMAFSRDRGRLARPLKQKGADGSFNKKRRAGRPRSRHLHRRRNLDHLLDLRRRERPRDEL